MKNNVFYKELCDNVYKDGKGNPWHIILFYLSYQTGLLWFSRY